MKKLLSIILTALTLLSAFGIAGASAEDASGLIMDIDMAELTNDGFDKTGNARLSVVGNVTTAAFTGYDGTNVPYAQFNQGSSNYIGIEASKNQNADGGNKFLNLNESTFEMWVKADDFQNLNPDFFMIRTASQANRESSLWLETDENGKILFVKGSTVFLQPKLAAPKEWNHIAVTRVNDCGSVTIKGYINGAYIGNYSYTAEKLDDSNANIYLGGSDGGRSNDFPGKLSGIKMYSKALSDDEINAEYKADVYKYTGKDPSIVFDANFENFADKMGNAVLTVQGTVEKGSFTGYDGSNVPYAQFDSNEENWISIDPEKNADASGGNKFLNKAETTIEMWLKADSLEANRYPHFLLIKRHSGELITSSTVGIELMVDGKMYPRINKEWITTGFIGAPKEWNHFVLTRSYDADAKTVTAKIYINGKLNTEGTRKNISQLDATDAKIYFGGTNEDRRNDFIGKISKIRMYDKVFTADEIKTEYEKDAVKYFADGATVDSIAYTKADNNLTAEISLSNLSAEDENYFISAVIYDNNKIIAISPETAVCTVTSEGLTKALTFTGLSALNLSDSAVLRVFAWKGMTMSPCSYSSDVNFTYNLSE